MEQMDSIRGELQTLIALEQQQVETLGAIHSRGAFNPTPMQVGGFGYGQSHYMPGMGAFQRIPALGNYMNQVQGALNYAQNSIPFMPTISTMADKMRNAMMSENLDSMGFFSANQSKMSNEAREMMGANVGAKFSAGALGAASMFSGTAGSFLGQTLGKAAFGGGLTGAAGGLLFGAAGGAVIGGTVDIMNDQVKQNFAYDRYLLQNSNKFIDVFESNNDRNVGGFSRKERWNMSNWLRHFNTENYMTDDDTMTLLKNFTEGDLLREVSNVDNFKEKMSQLTDSVKSMALSLNETYENVAQMMADLKRKGIDQRDYKNIAATSKVIGGLTGQDGAEVMEYTSNLTQSLTQNTRLDPDKMLKTVMGAEGYIGQFLKDSFNNRANSKEAEDLYNMLNNRGGVEGATTQYMSIAKELMSGDSNPFSPYMAAFFEYDGNDWKYRDDVYERFKNEGWSLDQLAAVATGKNDFGTGYLFAPTYAKSAFLENKEHYMMSTFGTGGVSSMSEVIDLIIKAAGKQTGWEGQSAEILLEGLLGVKGEDAKFAAITNEMIAADGGRLESKISAAGVAQAMVSDYQANHPGAWYSVKNWWGETKDTLGNVGTAVASPFRAMGLAFSDWWMGKPVEDMQNLWMETDWTKNPFDVFAESMGKYQEALVSAGADSSKITAANPGLFGGEYSTELSYRQVYSSIDGLTTAIKDLTGDTKDLEEAIREASKKGGVSENTSAALIKALGISDPTEAAEKIGLISAEIQKGKSEEDALRSVLSGSDLLDTEIQSVIDEFKVDDIKKADPNSPRGYYISGMNSEGVLRKTGLGDNFNQGAADKVNRMLQSSSWRAEDAFSQETLNAFSGAMVMPEEAPNVLTEIRPKIKEVTDLIKDYDKNGENSAWAKMGSEERLQYSNILASTYGYFTETGEIEQDYAKSYFSNDVIKYLRSGPGGVEISGKLIFTDDEKEIINNDRELSNSQNDFKIAGNWQKIVSGMRSGKYDLGNLSMVDYSSMTAPELEEYMIQEVNEANSAYDVAERDFLNAKSHLNEYISNNYSSYGDIWQGITSGRITSFEEYEKHIENNPRSADTTELGGKVKNYFEKKDTYTEAGEVKASAVTAKNSVSSLEEQMEVYQTGYVALGRALGMDDELLGRVKGNLSTKNINKGWFDTNKTTKEIQDDILETENLYAQGMFGDYYGQEITAANREAIAQQLTGVLSKTKQISYSDAEGMAETFVDSLAAGTKLDHDITGTFVNTALSAISFGVAGGKEKSLEEALADNTEALKNNTLALTGDKDINAKDGGVSESDAEKISKQTSASFDPYIFDRYNNNGTTTSTSGRKSEINLG